MPWNPRNTYYHPIMFTLPPLPLNAKWEVLIRVEGDTYPTATVQIIPDRKQRPYLSSPSNTTGLGMYEKSPISGDIVSRVYPQDLWEHVILELAGTVLEDFNRQIKILYRLAIEGHNVS